MNTRLSELLFPSVAKAVVKLKRVPIAIVGPDNVRHCGAGERAGEVEPWEGGCVLQVCTDPLISVRISHFVQEMGSVAFQSVNQRKDANLTVCT